ncbi:MAG: hypothetical protein K6B70_06545 [Clostridia bacterium]|nr:hypothetical protein [Clostridia bacterium]
MNRVKYTEIDFTNDEIVFAIELLDKVDSGTALSVAVFIDVLEYFSVLALVCFITASAILISITYQVCIFIRCRSPPVDSKRKILN